jgi:hypothetical protein
MIAIIEEASSEAFAVQNAHEWVLVAGHRKKKVDRFFVRVPWQLVPVTGSEEI